MSLFEPQSNEWLLNKFTAYKQLRNLDCAYWSEKYNLYVMTRYDDVFYILNNPDTFSSSKGNLIVEDPGRFNTTLGSTDNPKHNELKNIVKNAYSKDNIERVSKLFSQKAIEQFEGKTKLNISEITEELSAWAIAEILNFPLYKPYVKNVVIDSQRHNPFCLIKEHIENYEKNHKKLVTNYEKLENTTINKIPATGPGIYNEYVKNTNNKNPQSSLFLGGPMVSGAGSLIAALQFLTLDLYRENQLDVLIKDKSLIPSAVNESLRFQASTGRFSRTVMKEITIHGVDLKPGDRVAACLDSANRDDRKFVNPDKFDIFRNNTGHLSWGHGVHACIALAISKELLCVYLTILLEKIGKYEILTKNSDLEYKIPGGGTVDIIKNIFLKKT